MEDVAQPSLFHFVVMHGDMVPGSIPAIRSEVKKWWSVAKRTGMNADVKEGKEGGNRGTRREAKYERVGTEIGPRNLGLSQGFRDSRVTRKD